MNGHPYLCWNGVQHINRSCYPMNQLIIVGRAACESAIVVVPTVFVMIGWWAWEDWPIRLRQFGHDWSSFVVCTEILWLVTSWPVPTNLWTINPRILKHNVRHLRWRSAIGLEFNLDAAARNWSTKSRSIKNGKWQGLFYCKNWHPKIYLGDLT